MTLNSVLAASTVAVAQRALASSVFTHSGPLATNALANHPCLPVRGGHLSTRQYARIVKAWVKVIGLDPAMYGTHTMRRDKGFPDLSQDKKLESGSTAARSYEAGKHCPIPRDRDRRRLGDGGADRSLIVRCMATATAKPSLTGQERLPRLGRLFFL